MTSYMREQKHSQNLLQKIRKIKRRYRIDDRRMSGKVAELQDKVKALAAQVRNKQQKINAKQINRQFAENPKKCAQKHDKGNSGGKKPTEQGRPGEILEATI